MAKKSTSPKATYDVLGRVRFGGDLYKPGETVDMPEDAAAPLVATGVLKASAPAAPPAAPAT